MNQHRLIVNKDIIDWDYGSNPEEAPEKRLQYMLFYQMSRMCREKGAIKHDDRLDCLSQGVKYFTDALAISAQETVNQRKREDWADMLEQFQEDPQSMTNHLVLGLGLQQRRDARAKSGGRSGVPTWM